MFTNVAVAEGNSENDRRVAESDIVGVVVLVIANHLQVCVDIIFVCTMVDYVTLGVTIPLSAFHNHTLGESWQSFKFLMVNSQMILDSFKHQFVNPGCFSACFHAAVL